jgi:hypothetical protein
VQSVKVNRRIGGLYRTHLQSRRISHTKEKTNMKQVASNRNVGWLSADYTSLYPGKRIGGLNRLHLQGRRISHTKEPTWSRLQATETSVDFQRTTRRYIPEDRTLHKHRCENLRCCTWQSLIVVAVPLAICLDKGKVVPALN